MVVAGEAAGDRLPQSRLGPTAAPLQPAAATDDEQDDDDEDDEHVRTTAVGGVRLTDTLKSIGADSVISIIVPTSDFRLYLRLGNLRSDGKISFGASARHR